MRREIQMAVAGVLVLAAGLYAFVGRSGPASTPSSVDPGVIAQADSSTPDITVPDLPGVPADVGNVLYAAGAAELMAGDELTGVPSPITEVLSARGVTLVVADGSEGVEP